MTTTTAEPTPEVTEQKQKNLQDELTESARRVWLAGLGALAAAGEEGSKVFNRLVERGKDVEGRSKDTVGKTYERAKEEAKSTWKDLGSSLDETLTATLHRLGVPTRDEILNLTRRVEELSAKVEQLKARPAHEAEPVLAEGAGEKGAKPRKTN